MRTLFTAVLLCAITITTGFAQQANSTAANDQWDFLSANRMLMWLSNNGAMAHDPVRAGAGLEWPRGSGRYLMFAQGLVWGGLVEGDVRIGGATYTYGWQAGVILADGTADDPSNPLHRLFHVRRFDPAWWHGVPEYARARFLQDLIEWPVQFGAPWTDANGNGVYDPDTTAWLTGGMTDTPAWRGEEMLWFASNDMNPIRTMNLYGTPPAGVEMHTLAWASAGHPLLDNTVFLEHTLINKGPMEITDMSLAMWEDPDLGEPFDDVCGVDTALGMAISYNGIKRDNEYGIPPASATVWLQTPVAPEPGSTARFGGGSRAGYRNLPLSSFMFYIGGSSIYRDPTLKAPSGAVMMMNNLVGRGWDGQSYVDPVTAQSTAFLLSGDPVLDRGWVDGVTNSPGDRRFLSASGRYTLAPGDTQKVTFARVAVKGGNRLLSVRALRKAARQLHDIYHNLAPGAPAPVFTSDLTWPAPGGVYRIRVSGGPFPAGTNSVSAFLRDPSGREVQRTPLNDDGMQGDAQAGDGIYAAVFDGLDAESGADLFIESTDADGVKQWFVDGELALPGPAIARLTDVLLDSPQPDGRAQPGEYVRYRVRIENQTTKDMGPWHLFFRGEQGQAADRVVGRWPVTVPHGASWDTSYDPADPASYVAIDLPADTPPGRYDIPVTLISEQHCAWEQTLSIDVDTLPAAPAHGLLVHVQGNASGSLGYTILNPSALTGHDYRVSIEGEDFGPKTMHVEDVTLGTTLYRDIPVPGPLAPFSPEIDGWAVNRGTAFDELVYDGQGARLESFINDYTATFSEPSRAWFRLYDDEVTMAGEFYFPSLSTQYDLVPVRLVFDRANGQKAPLYIRGVVPNYSCAGVYDIPVRAYDISDSANPRQIMVGFCEQKNRLGNDSSYMPTAEVYDREFLMLFADDYREQPDAKFLVPLDTRNATLEMMYLFWALRDSTLPMFEDGDAYTIVPRVPVSNRDVYITPPDGLLDVRSTPSSPSTLALHAPYPNPVRGRAEIVFDTRAAGSVRLSVHDLLGRHIATLVDRRLERGTHRVTLSAAGLRSGTYVVSLTSGGERATRLISVVR